MNGIRDCITHMLLLFFPLLMLIWLFDEHQWNCSIMYSMLLFCCFAVFHFRMPVFFLVCLSSDELYDIWSLIIIIQNQTTEIRGQKKITNESKLVSKRKTTKNCMSFAIAICMLLNITYQYIHFNSVLVYTIVYLICQNELAVSCHR